jgi:hypothetical protein
MSATIEIKELQKFFASKQITENKPALLNIA